VIARIWRGWTTPENADAYQQIVSQEVLPGIAARNLDGYHGAYLLRSCWPLVCSLGWWPPSSLPISLPWPW
jgi:hypothetical protein